MEWRYSLPDFYCRKREAECEVFSRTVLKRELVDSNRWAYNATEPPW